ncbi:MAG TPA: nitroreductase [Alphaproteobacteria bacterium]|nr:nitroreductase [Alphaproteobacteria bacterium]
MKTSFAVLSLLLSVQSAFAAETINLPAPRTTGGMPLMDALSARKSTRSFADKPIEPQVLADMLWAAFGVNRPDGKRTAPTAMNRQDMDVYVLNKDGAFLYDAAKNVLLPVSDKDLRDVNAQPFAKKAPVTLLYAAKDGKFAGMHAGSLYQNVGLFCASAGLNNVVRGGKDNEEMTKALNLPDGKRVIVSQVVGYPE